MNLYIITVTKMFSEVDIYVIAEDFKQAAEKGLSKVRELKWDRVDDRVSAVKLIATPTGVQNKLIVL